MYIPKAFAIYDHDEIVDFIQANGFGQLISQSEGRLCASHLPFLLNDEHTHLRTHLARENPQTEDIEGQEVMVTLQGPHGYISPTWYQKPGVPTWNYQAVHIYGRCRVLTDAASLAAIVNSLAAKYEAEQPSPWDGDYDARLLTMIIGLEIEITDIQCQYKLSQNRNDAERYQLIQQLNDNGSVELARAMLAGE